jgi:hypothetical protein
MVPLSAWASVPAWARVEAPVWFRLQPWSCPGWREGSGVSVPVGLRIGLGNDNSQCGTGHRLYCHCSSRVVMSIMII